MEMPHLLDCVRHVLKQVIALGLEVPRLLLAPFHPIAHLGSIAVIDRWVGKRGVGKGREEAHRHNANVQHVSVVISGPFKTVERVVSQVTRRGSHHV